LTQTTEYIEIKWFSASEKGYRCRIRPVMKCGNGQEQPFLKIWIEPWYIYSFWSSKFSHCVIVTEALNLQLNLLIP